MNALHCGDWVFVHPDERSAPPEIRGLAGTVTRIDGERASVAFRHHGTTIALEVELTLLRLERRRRDRPAANWSHDLAQAG